MNWLLTPHTGEELRPRSGVAPYPHPTIQVKFCLRTVWGETRTLIASFAASGANGTSMGPIGNVTGSTESPLVVKCKFPRTIETNPVRALRQDADIHLGSILTFERKKKPWYFRDNRA